ncbi:MAG: hypothetical protein HRU19_21835 [Pseudobacteriovorax sp.]|nr:hypothetical protein [Pseudobacteriovorax sp.]
MNRRHLIAQSALAVFAPKFAFGQNSELKSLAINDLIKDASRGLGEQTESITVLFPQGSKGNLIPVADAFESLTGIKVMLREASLNDISEEMLLAKRVSSSKNLFDVALPPSFSLPSLAEEDVIEPLDKYVRLFEPKPYKDSYLYNISDSFLKNFYG